MILTFTVPLHLIQTQEGVSRALDQVNLAIAGDKEVNKWDSKKGRWVAKYPEHDERLQEVHYKLRRGFLAKIQVEIDELTGKALSAEVLKIH